MDHVVHYNADPQKSLYYSVLCHLPLLSSYDSKSIWLSYVPIKSIELAHYEQFEEPMIYSRLHPLYIT